MKKHWQFWKWSYIVATLLFLKVLSVSPPWLVILLAGGAFGIAIFVMFKTAPVPPKPKRKKVSTSDDDDGWLTL